jgi:hypothetical protein
MWTGGWSAGCWWMGVRLMLRDTGLNGDSAAVALIWLSAAR